MRSSAWAAAAALSLLPSVASAADDFIKGVYLTSEELCAQAKKDSLQSVIEAGNTILTSRGIESIEYNCEFVQVTKATLSPAWLVNAVCQEPGYLFPDVLSIVQLNATQINLVSVTPVDPESGGGNSGSYYFCDGVALP
jgi:hypothetical protein